MSLRLKLIAFSLVFLNIFFGSWTVLHGDIYFKSDVARDFLLFQEIAQKKIVLIGPRASGIMGVYHGPLWLYLNYPAYLLGSGYPVIVGWYWVGLIIVGLVLSFIVIKKLFSEKAAWIYLIFASGYFIQEAKGLFNPDGAFLLMPVFYFFIVRYCQTFKAKYLLGLILVSGVLIQFQMAVGVPLTLLSGIVVGYLIIKKKKYTHFLLFPVICIPLVSFILFELRHNFAELHAIFIDKELTHISLFSFLTSLYQRIQLSTVGSIQVFRYPFDWLSLIPTVILSWFFIIKFRTLPKIEKYKYKIFLYLYFGTWIFTLIIPGLMMSHQWIPLAALAMLILASIEKYLDKRIFFILICIVVLQNSYFWYQEISGHNLNIGQQYDSWQFQKQLSDWIIQDGETEFGYFAYAPDVYAYGPKYTLSYMKQINLDKKIYAFEKKPITYVVYEPVPTEREDLSPLEWRKSKFGILANPVKTKVFPNGYKIDKFILNDSEINLPNDPDLDTGVFFR